MKQNLKRFDIILVDFRQNAIDSEQNGIRPAIIIQNDVGNLCSGTTIVMPLSSKVKKLNQSTHTLLKKGGTTGLIKNSVVLGECIRQISEKRIVKYIGFVSEKKDKIEIKRVYDANFGEVD